MVRALRSAVVLVGLAAAACGGETSDDSRDGVGLADDASTGSGGTAGAGGAPGDGAGGRSAPPSAGGAAGMSHDEGVHAGAPGGGDAGACFRATPDRTTGAPAAAECPCITPRQDPSGEACSTPGTTCWYDTDVRCWIVSCECTADGAWDCMQLLC